MRLVGVFRCFECSVGDRGEVAERGVRPCRVVFVTPEGDDGPGVAQVPEAVDVEAFVAQTGVERLDAAVVPRCSGRDEYQARVPVGPGGQRLGGELGTVVGPDRLRVAALGDDLVEHTGQRRRRDGPLDQAGQGLAGVLINHSTTVRP